jgi:hypothetical protein
VGANSYHHEVQAVINGVTVGSVAFDGAVPVLLEGVIPRAALRDTSTPGAHNELALSYTSDAPPEDPGMIYLDHVNLLATAAAPAGLSVPTSVVPFTPQLPSLSGCDYLIVAHPRFRAQAERLARLKQAAGYHPVVVDVLRAYDSFSAGFVEGEAIRALIRTAAQRAALRYVVLFGDDSFDYRDDVGSGSIPYVPSLYGWDGEYGRVPSETRFSDLNGDGSPDVAIGRLPAKDETEARVLVDKIATFGQEIRTRVDRHLFVTDRDDPTPGAPSFSREAIHAAAAVGASQTVWADAAQGQAVARTTLLGALGSGVAFTHVFAHGAPWQWGNAGLLTVDDVEGAAATVPDGLPTILLNWACESQMFTYLWGDTVNEALVLRPRGGALAAFGPAGISDMAVQATLYERLYPELRRSTTLGLAIQRAKSRALAEDSRAWRAVAGWNLLGDPALPLR